MRHSRWIGGILPILKCDCCKDGYLIVRKKDYQPFLGCTNDKEGKSGCNRRINLTYYEKMLKRGEIENVETIIHNPLVYKIWQNNK